MKEGEEVRQGNKEDIQKVLPKVMVTEEPSRNSTPNLLEPLNYEIIQVDDDDDEEDEEEIVEDEEEDEILEEEEFQEENKPKKSTNKLLVDISQSIKWHEIIQENNDDKPELKKRKLNIKN